jgi:hypothetical protein
MRDKREAPQSVGAGCDAGFANSPVSTNKTTTEGGDCLRAIEYAADTVIGLDGGRNSANEHARRAALPGKRPGSAAYFRRRFRADCRRNAGEVRRLLAERPMTPDEARREALGHIRDGALPTDAATLLAFAYMAEGGAA